MIFIRSNRFRKDLPQYNNSLVVKLPYPTNSSLVIAKYAKQAMQSIFKKGFEFKKAGIVVMGLVPEEVQQLNMFEVCNSDHKQLIAIIDNLNSKMWKNTLNSTSQKFGSS